MSNFSIDPDEQVLFIFFEENAQPTEASQSAIEECRLAHRLEGGWVQDSNILMFKGHGSALIFAERELHEAGLSVAITTYNELHQDAPKDTYGEDFNEEPTETMDFDPTHDFVLAIYPFTETQLSEIKRATDPDTLVSQFMDKAKGNPNWRTDIENLADQINAHQAICKTNDKEDCVYIVGSKNSIDFAQAFLSGIHGTVLMTMDQYLDRITPWAVEETTPIIARH
jgi:hypothetical protein